MHVSKFMFVIFLLFSLHTFRADGAIKVDGPIFIKAGTICGLSILGAGVCIYTLFYYYNEADRLRTALESKGAKISYKREYIGRQIIETCTITYPATATPAELSALEREWTEFKKYYDEPTGLWAGIGLCSSVGFLSGFLTYLSLGFEE